MIDRNRHAPGEQTDLTIELGRARLPVYEAAKLGQGSIVSLDALVDEPVDIRVEGRLVAKGEVLMLDGTFCVRVTELIARSTDHPQNHSH